ncbi:hypothetical protein BCR34DRAFT_318082 [Clohesyomyces aquaticus]|uniref:Uncharacterized protein n=1 Tax=Clohesyomyces aquaticus TaxID=1231657 RepID=A0A1Y1ZMZ0_9PLEO|nr:hypothetical protein BCR34DRAFT_318082 [Clohesyomyces aquaticus]
MFSSVPSGVIIEEDPMERIPPRPCCGADDEQEQDRARVPSQAMRDCCGQPGHHGHGQMECGRFISRGLRAGLISPPAATVVFPSGPHAVPFDYRLSLASQQRSGAGTEGRRPSGWRASCVSCLSSRSARWGVVPQTRFRSTTTRCCWLAGSWALSGCSLRPLADERSVGFAESRRSQLEARRTVRCSL